MNIDLKKPILSFDLDGTLMQPGFGDKVWLEGLPRIYAHRHDLPFEEAKERLLTAYETLGNSRREWYDLSYWIQELDLKITPEELLDNFSRYIQPYPEVPNTIKQCSKHYTLIISSAAMKQFITIELQTSHLDIYFFAIFSATTDTQTVKKDPFFYEMIAQKMHCSPHEIVHVGDNYDFDYVSPTRAGMNAIYLDRTSTEKGSHIIHNLSDLKEKIREYSIE